MAQVFCCGTGAISDAACVRLAPTRLAGLEDRSSAAHCGAAWALRAAIIQIPAGAGAAAARRAAAHLTRPQAVHAELPADIR